MGDSKRQRQKANRNAKIQAEWSQYRSRRRTRIVGIILLIALLGTVVGTLVTFAGDDDGTQALDTTDPLGDDPTDDSAPEGDAPGDTAGDEPGEPADSPVAAFECPAPDGSSPRQTTFDGIPGDCTEPDTTYRATIETTKGTMVWEMSTATSPVTVNSFVTLARYHYYDGVAFHRIIPGFVVQGGDANGNPPGTGGPGYSLGDVPGFTGETPASGGYEIGDVAMANSGSDPNTSGSQFFVVSGDQGATLPPDFALLGRVVEGMDVVEALDAVGSAAGTPTEPVEIISVEITEA